LESIEVLRLDVDEPAGGQQRRSKRLAKAKAKQIRCATWTKRKVTRSDRKRPQGTHISDSLVSSFRTTTFELGHRPLHVDWRFTSGAG